MAQYGLGQAASDFTSGLRTSEDESREQARYDQKQQRLDQQEQRASERHNVGMDVRREQLESLRRKAKAEGMDTATKLLLSGRLRDAEQAWNSQGSQRIKPGSLQYDQKTGKVEWVEIGPEGQEIPGQAKDRMLAAIAGVSFSDGTGSGKRSATLQLLDAYTQIFGDRKKAVYYMNLSKQDPAEATARIYNTLSDANSEMLPDDPDRLSDDDLWAKAKQMVVDAQRTVGKQMYGIEEEPPANQGGATGGALAAPPGGESMTSAQPVNPNDPESWSTLW